MGAHHFKLHLVPPGAFPLRDSEGSFEGDFLASFHMPNSVVSRLRSIFSTSTHWGGVEEFTSGNEWGSDLRIFRAGEGHITDIAFRYAPVADPLDTLREFVSIARELGCHPTFSSIPQAQ